MEYEEYKNKVAGEHAELRNRLNKLAKDYAFANNTVREGEMVTDNIGTIKVEKIRFSITLDVPVCVYSGRTYTKKGKPTKANTNRDVWQSNLVR